LRFRCWFRCPRAYIRDDATLPLCTRHERQADKQTEHVRYRQLLGKNEMSIVSFPLARRSADTSYFPFWRNNRSAVSRISDDRENINNEQWSKLGTRRCPDAGTGLFKLFSNQTVFTVMSGGLDASARGKTQFAIDRIDFQLLIEPTLRHLNDV